MRRALCLIREAPCYRRDSFERGLRAVGFHLTRQLSDPRPGDLLCIWNRYGHFEEVAEKFERAGARVVVAENGYIGQDDQGRQLYAIAEGQHNVAGSWHIGNGGRFARLGIEPRPWRQDGKHILVTAQRGIGSKLMASPRGWAEDVARRLKERTTREVRIRPHPGNKAPAKPLEEDLRDCWAVVTWASGAAVKALIAGIPVFYCAPHWILEGAARKGIDDIESPWMGDRTPHLERMAYAQFTVDEIASGEPFRLLLNERRAA